MTLITDSDIATATTHLQRLIQIDTTNPPGNELNACLYIKSVLDQENIPAQILESAPGRANIIARLGGDGSAKPFLFTSHLDVVPAEKEYWSEDPFAGIIKNNFIWGRGAVDMKNMTALALTLFVKCHRDKVKLKRDIIFAAVADEEAGCTLGSKWLVDNHPDLIRAEYAVNEVGGFSMTIDKQVFYPIGVAEKGVCWFEVVATGTPGHGAMPHDDQAIGHVCFAAHKLARTDLPFHNSQIVTDFITALSQKTRFPKNLILKSLAKENYSDFSLKHLLPDQKKARQLKNMFHNLATPTKLTAGYKENVIPGTASVTIDGRVLPEQSLASFLNEVQMLIGDGFQIKLIHGEEPYTMPNYDDAFYGVLKSTLIKHDPGCWPVPFLIPGFTDAKQYQRLGIKCYGFAPVKLPADLNFGDLYHGHNERLPLGAIAFGLQVLWDVVGQTCR